MYTAPKAALLLTALIFVGGTSCDDIQKKLKDPLGRNEPGRVHRQKGIEAFKKQRWAEAAQEWQMSLDARPEQKELYEKLAFAWVKAGKLDEAAEVLKKTVAFQETPKDKLDITRKIAAMYMQGGRLDKAEQYYQEVLKVEPKDDAAITWLGEIQSVLGGARAAAIPADLPRLEQAIAYYDQALEINPENLTPWVNKRIALFKMRDHWQLKKNAADKELAELPKKKKKEREEATTRSAEAQAKIDELAPRVEVVSAKVSELVAKRKAAQAAADAGDGGGGGGGGGTASGDDAGTPTPGADGGA